MKLSTHWGRTNRSKSKFNLPPFSVQAVSKQRAAEAKTAYLGVNEEIGCLQPLKKVKMSKAWFIVIELDWSNSNLTDPIVKWTDPIVIGHH